MLDFLVGNDLLSAIVAFGLVLIPAVIVHEFGHFLAARAVGITVLEFGIGFPPRIGRLFTWRETEFTLNMIPLGGFVRPLGEDMIRPVGEEKVEQDRQRLLKDKEEGATVRTADRDLKREDPYQAEREELAARGVHDLVAVNDVKPLPRIFFMVGGALANFIFALLVFIAVGMIGIPKEVGTRVGISTLPGDSVLAAAGIQPDDVIEQIDGEYFTSSADLAARLDASIGESVTLTVTRPTTDTRSQQQFDVSIIPTPQLVELFRGTNQYVLITQVDENSPGESAGLQAGDLVAEFNGLSLSNAPDPSLKLQQLTDEHAGQEVALTILHNGERQVIHVTPRENPPADSGRIGIRILSQHSTKTGDFAFVTASQFVSTPQSPLKALTYGADRTASIFRMIASFPARILGGSAEPEERRVISAVGVSQLGGALLQDSIEENQPVILLEYIALISIALGVTNLLPIPALDGGRVLFVIVEMIRGRPISPEREGLVHLVGLIFILSIGVIFIINDLLHPLTDILP